MVKQSNLHYFYMLGEIMIVWEESEISVNNVIKLFKLLDNDSLKVHTYIIPIIYITITHLTGRCISYPCCIIAKVTYQGSNNGRLWRVWKRGSWIVDNDIFSTQTVNS